jgi:hypothetical protein
VYRKRASFLGNTPDRKSASHGFSNISGERKSQSAAMDLSCSGCRTSVERLEYSPEIFPANPDAFVLNRNSDFLYTARLICERGSNADPAAISTVLYGIRNQVLQTLGQSLEVNHYWWQL